MASKLVLVSGASSGIGAAAAMRYGRAGARVLLLARNAERLHRVAEAIRHAGGSAAPYVIDLADAAAIEQTAAQIKREHGTPDILINNAGAGRWLPLIETTADEALHMIEVPYLAAFNLTRSFLPEMLERGGGTLAYITSPGSFIAWPDASAYIAARRAVAGLADTLQSELKGTGVFVTLVVFGTVESGYWEHNPGSRERLPAISPILAPILSCDEAAEAIFRGVEARKRMVVKPAILRAVFVLNALFPRLVASQLRRAVPKQR
jgi:short-subunit dehydrogenase